MNNYLVTYITDDGLKHHGILGQKWGVRRYQNYDGTYTQAGLKRYNASKEKYDKYSAEYKEAKKTGTETNQMKIRKLNAKSQMKKDYKHLKQDKLGDEGKLLYAKGYRIKNGKAQIASALGSIGLISLGEASMVYSNPNLFEEHTDSVAKALAAIGGMSLAAAGITAASKIPDKIKDKKLRAYYSHSSKY